MAVNKKEAPGRSWKNRKFIERVFRGLSNNRRQLLAAGRTRARWYVKEGEGRIEQKARWRHRHVTLECFMSEGIIHFAETLDTFFLDTFIHHSKARAWSSLSACFRNTGGKTWSIKACFVTLKCVE